MPPMSNGTMYGNNMITNYFDDDLNLSSASFLHFDSGSFDPNFAGFGGMM